MNNFIKSRFKIFFPLLILAFVSSSSCSSKRLSTNEFQKTIDSFSEADSVDLCFFVIGDWGRRGQYGQSQLGKTMAAFADVLNPEYIVSTGDNFYPDGVKDLNDSHWKESFEEPYGFASLQSIKWYIVLGNHDVRGNVQAQVDYHTVNPIWHLPSAYYSQIIPAGEDSILLVFLETNSFSTGYYQSDTYGSYVRAQDTTAQLIWFEQLLKEHPHTPTYVFGHHPLYSAGARAGQSNSVRTHLEHRLEQHGVKAYIAGHEHDVQHLRPEGTSVNYFVSGAGSALRDIKQPEAAVFAQSVNAFMVVRIVGSRTYVSFINTSGEEIYRTLLTN